MYSFDIILKYSYEFATAFAFCAVGSFLRQAFSSVPKSKKINVPKIFISTVFSAILMCAFIKYKELSFELFVLTCVLFGMYSNKLMMILMSEKFGKRFLNNILDRFTDSIFKEAAKDAFNDMENNKKNKQDKKE